MYSSATTLKMRAFSSISVWLAVALHSSFHAPPSSPSSPGMTRVCSAASLGYAKVFVLSCRLHKLITNLCLPVCRLYTRLPMRGLCRVGRLFLQLPIYALCCFGVSGSVNNGLLVAGSGFAALDYMGHHCSLRLAHASPSH